MVKKKFKTMFLLVAVAVISATGCKKKPDVNVDETYIFKYEINGKQYEARNSAAVLINGKVHIQAIVSDFKNSLAIQLNSSKVGTFTFGDVELQNKAYVESSVENQKAYKSVYELDCDTRDDVFTNGTVNITKIGNKVGDVIEGTFSGEVAHKDHNYCDNQPEIVPVKGSFKILYTKVD